MPKIDSIKKTLVLGSGPIIIGQAAEFDYSGTQACQALKEEGIEVVLINSNPATIMTDKEVAHKIYIEPLTIEAIEKVIEKERPDSLLAGMGGQTGLNLAVELHDAGILDKYGVKIKAKVPSINLLKTEIMVEIAPIVGNRNQAEDLIEYIKGNMKDNPDGIWDTNIFGKTIEQIVSDGIYEKTHNMTTESMGKIGDTIEKVMNENSGLVCLIV